MRWVFGVAVLIVALSYCQVNCGVTGEPPRAVVARAQIENFKIALKTYRHDVGDYPSTVEGLQALRVNPGHAGWDGPYMPQDIPRDPWGVPYEYVYIGGKPRITASGSK